MNRGYAPKTVPTPLLVGGGIVVLLAFMYLLLSFVSMQTGPAPPKTDTYGPNVPYYETPVATQAAPRTSWKWWESGERKEQEFRQDAYDAFQRREFDTDRKMEQIKQEQEFRKMQRSVTEF